MTKEEFKFKSKSIFLASRCLDFDKHTLGFKMKNEINDNKSNTITVQVLLICEKLYGRSFMYNTALKDINFKEIENYLLESKEMYMNIDNNCASSFVVCRAAYCGIGLALLGRNEEAKELANKLCEHKLNNEYVWGMTFASIYPDVLPTYLVTMLLNRLHYFQELRTVPEFIRRMYNSSNRNGASFSELDSNKYMEALTLICYMYKFYYHKDVNVEKKLLINEFYDNKKEAICNAQENYFSQHPTNQWRLFCFGLAANVVGDIDTPFYTYILEKITDDFDRIDKAIPYILEISRLYHAVLNNLDPFKSNRILGEIKNLDVQINDGLKNVDVKMNKVLDEIKRFEKYNRALTVKMPIVIVVVGVLAIIAYLITSNLIEYFLKDIILAQNVSEAVYKIVNFVISILSPCIAVSIKKVRIKVVTMVTWLYKKMNISYKDMKK